MSKLEGKVAVITGGSSGIGLAAAQLFASEGARIFITGRGQNELDAAVKEIGKNAIGVLGDASSLEALDRLYGQVKQRQARIDVLVINAGGGEFDAPDSITEEQFDKAFSTNVKGLLLTVQKALPLLQDRGSIILTASLTTSKGVEAFRIYNATNAALRSFAHDWASDLKPHRIRVNVITPHPIDAPILSKPAATNEEANQLKTNLAAAPPEAPINHPDEIAKAALFLASADSTFVTGIELIVNGYGATLRPITREQSLNSKQRQMMRFLCQAYYKQFCRSASY